MLAGFSIPQVLTQWMLGNRVIAILIAIVGILAGIRFWQNIRRAKQQYEEAVAAAQPYIHCRNCKRYYQKDAPSHIQDGVYTCVELSSNNLGDLLGGRKR